MVADFIVEFTLMKGEGAEVVPQWSVHIDGSSNKQAGRASVVLHTPKDRVHDPPGLSYDQ